MIPYSKYRGQALIILVFAVLVIGLLITASLVFVGAHITRTTRNLDWSVKSYYVAEGGIEDLLLRSRTAALQMPSSPSVLTVGEGTATRTYAQIGIASRFSSRGVVSDRHRLIEITTSSVTEGGFNYGVQVGDLGLVMGLNSEVVGNVYSNGDIRGNAATKTRITGDAISAANHIIEDIEVMGDARADRFDDCIVGGTAHYVASITDCSAGSTSVLSEPPPESDFPISAAQISGWKSDAEAGGTLAGYTLGNNSSDSLGPVKISGSMTIGNGSTVTLTGTVWVTGTLNLGNGVTIRLDPDIYSDFSGVLIFDSPISVKNNVSLQGSGEEGSYLLVLDTFSSAIDTAIDVNNNVGGAILYANNGIIEIKNNLSLLEATARGLRVNNGVSITYESGLEEVLFNSGSGGGRRFLWKETF